MKLPRIEDLRVFVSAAELGSFTKAAHLLGLSPIVASAVIKRLEQNLGVRLFERSTRKVRLSTMGERYLPYAQNTLQTIALGEASLNNKACEAELPNPLRISLPSDLTRQCLVSWIQNYFESLNTTGSKPRLELRISDRVSDLLHDQVDFAIRYGVPQDSGFIALPLAPNNRRILCAAPSYLEKHGMPQKLSDIQKLNCLRFVIGDSVYSHWRFRVSNNLSPIEVNGSHIADDASVVRQWAIDGLGIAYKSYLDVAKDIANKKLVHLLPKVEGEAAPLYFFVVSKQHLTPSIRRLVAYLANQCEVLTRITV